MAKIFCFCIAIQLCIAPFLSFAQESFSVYPVKGIFVSDKVENDQEFIRSLGDKRQYAIQIFHDGFLKNFTNSTKNIDEKNKYNTFVASLQIPRVSQYRIKKSASLVDLYLPITMSINFANIMTGESLYTYSYTYYAKYETTSASESSNRIVELYRATFTDLLNTVLAKAKTDFKPFSISAKIVKVWNTNFIMDKGNERGIAKGDVLTDQYGNQLSVVHASQKYSVAKTIIGDPKSDAIFGKYSNVSIDEIKKPKLLLFPDIAKNRSNSVPDNMVYQLFRDALGNKATFSIISVDKSFSNVQKAVTENTNLSQTITQNRGLPDFFLKLYFYGPFYVNLPTNKEYVKQDNYSMTVCGDIVDKSGRVMYGKCINEKITDEILSNVGFSNEARQEIIIKNALIGLANIFIENVKFKHVEYNITKTDKDSVFIDDKHNMLVSDSNVTSFHNIGKVSGIDEDVYVPTWQLKIIGKDNNNVMSSKLLPFFTGAPEPSERDGTIISDSDISVFAAL